MSKKKTDKIPNVGDYPALLRSGFFKRTLTYTLRQPILRKQHQKQHIFQTAAENVSQAGFVPGCILPEEIEFLLSEGVELFRGVVPRWSEKTGAFSRGNAAMGREYYMRLRDVIVSLFYYNPTSPLLFDRCLQYIRKEHYSGAAIVYQFLNKFGYINFGFLNMDEISQGEIDKTIIVVGAGAAGLAATRQLVKLGFKVKLIEAQNRIGGRVFSKTIDKISLEFGADSSAGTDANMLHLLCKQNRISIETQEESSCPLYSIIGEILHPQIEEDVEYHFNQLLDAIPEWKESRMKGSGRLDDESLQSALTYLRKNKLNLPSSTNEEITFKKIFLSALSWYESCLEYELGTSLNNISLRCWDVEGEFDFSGPIWSPSRDLESILSLMRDDIARMNNSEDEPLLQQFFNQPVHSISYFADHPVTVSCATGNQYKADAVLLTVPLGVLKKQTISFTPQLPLWKTEAIENLGFGSVNKLILWFESVFWPASDRFGVSPQDENLKGSQFLFLNLYPKTKQPILVAISIGGSGDIADVKSALVTLNRLFGKRVTMLVKSFASHWDTDKYAYGSFSHLAVGSSGTDYDSMAHPINNRLFFAGEATNRHRPATIAGAMLSGLREAGRIHQLFSSTSALDIQMKYELVYFHISEITKHGLHRCLPYSRNKSHELRRDETKDLEKLDAKLMELANATDFPSLDDIASAIDIENKKAEPVRPPMAPAPQISSRDVTSGENSRKPSQESKLPANWYEFPIGQTIIKYANTQLNVFSPSAGSANCDTIGLAMTLARKYLDLDPNILVKNAVMTPSMKLGIRTLVKEIVRFGCLDQQSIEQFPMRKRPPTSEYQEETMSRPLYINDEINYEN